MPNQESPAAKKKRLAKAKASNQRYEKNAKAAGKLPVAFRKYVPAHLKTICQQACHDVVNKILEADTGREPEKPILADPKIDVETTAGTDGSDFDDLDQSVPEHPDDYSQL